jgi:hypothetical protein
MSPEQLEKAEQLAIKWHSGDGDAWPSLKAMMKCRLLEKTAVLSEGLSPNDRKRVHRMIIQIFEKSAIPLKAELVNRVGFNGYCALAIRRVLVELVGWLQKQPDDDSLRQRLNTTEFFTRTIESG